MLYGWEGNHRSDVARAMRHRLSGTQYPPMGLMAWEREMSLRSIQSTMASLPFYMSQANQRHIVVETRPSVHDHIYRQCQTVQLLKYAYKC